jgi:hemerythrin superfamily protein
MARAKRNTKRSGSQSRGRRTTAARRSGSRSAKRNGNGSAHDAIALLKADHRQVEGWFEQFEKTNSDERKQDLAQRICAALKAHTTIEEEIFYPAFLEATEEEDIHHEAQVEHDGAKKLIAEIEAAGPDDDYFDARVTVLSEMIKHHVKEEEKRDGMFAKARRSDMDLAALGEQLEARKAEIMGEESDDETQARLARPRSMQGERSASARMRDR